MVLLGSTGSIGRNTLSIAKKFNLKITALCANKNSELLNRQIEEFSPKFVAIGDEAKACEINHANVFAGAEGVLEMIDAAYKEGMVLVNALVGIAGLAPTAKALEKGYKVALANKESLVSAGEFLDISRIVPIDSEHFGLWYLLNGREPKKLTLTASGGAFRDTPLERLKNAKIEEALNHPNWKMGQKITIDSATMINKLFEILEARWLFNANNIDALIEPKSIVHALVDFVDGSTTAHLAKTDMRLPIAFALLGEVKEPILSPVNLLEIKNIEFHVIDFKRYPAWELREILLEKPHLGTVLNAANETAAELFLQNKIAFTDIAVYSLKAMKEFESAHARNLGEVFSIDKEVKAFCTRIKGVS
ncbi:MAG: 1-deoxy-D-xylulose-5-phosphate reductoisomerase [Campylobacteraceae bacterium]|jgi:1-deoxy-D-xylulose-5-phosphate reductoisomerase|nr:1-deoxy-D-xylulose-5-phosphate reductoisomerase [Campylobacteraceae bacterium]